MSSSEKLLIYIYSIVDSRRRERFVSEPLVGCGHEVIIESGYALKTLLLMFVQKVRGRKQPEIFVIFGTGLKPLFIFLTVSILGVPTIFRLGGHPLETKKSFFVNKTFFECLGEFKNLVNYWATKLIFKHAKYVICVNQVLATRLKRDLNSGAKVYVVPQYSSGFVPINTRKLNEVPNILTVTNLKYESKARGVIWLIDALSAYCLKSNRRLRFNILGDGFHIAIVVKHISEAKISPLLEVNLAGYTDNPEKCYAKADLFMYHSTEDGTPNVILDAKRWGIPTLLNDYEAFSTIVDDGKSGLIFRSLGHFTQLLDNLLADEVYRNRIGASAQMEHNLRFSKLAVSEQLQETINSILNQ